MRAHAYAHARDSALRAVFAGQGLVLHHGLEAAARAGVAAFALAHAAHAEGDLAVVEAGGELPAERAHLAHQLLQLVQVERRDEGLGDRCAEALLALAQKSAHGGVVRAGVVRGRFCNFVTKFPLELCSGLARDPAQFCERRRVVAFLEVGGESTIILEFRCALAQEEDGK